MSRRAIAAGCEFDRDAGDRCDDEPLTGHQIDSAIVYCTLSDIGDPRFRVWLVEQLGTRFARQLDIKLEIVA